MAKWLQFLLRGGRDPRGTPLVSPATLNSLLENAAPLPPNGLLKPTYPFSLTFSGYSLGWFSGVYEGFQIIQHGGDTLGHHSMVTLFPGTSTGVFVALASTDNMVPTLFRELVSNKAFDLLRGVSTFDSDWACSFFHPASFADSRSAAEVEPAFQLPTGLKVTRPPLDAQGWGSRGKQLTSAAQLTAGTYTHPFWGSLRVWHELNGQETHFALHALNGTLTTGLYYGLDLTLACPDPSVQRFFMTLFGGGVVQNLLVPWGDGNQLYLNLDAPGPVFTLVSSDPTTTDPTTDPVPPHWIHQLEMWMLAVAIFFGGAVFLYWFIRVRANPRSKSLLAEELERESETGAYGEFATGYASMPEEKRGRKINA